VTRLGAIAVVAAIAVSACSSGSGKSNGSTGATSPVKTLPATTPTTFDNAHPLEIVVTNDDGYSAPGIAAIATALANEPATHVDVVAPAQNRSGTSDKTTPGRIVTHNVKTADGMPATAVDGYPADTVNVALDQLHLKPALVVSGVNFGANVGPLTAISGTVGAAKQAVRRGIPALAVSQGSAAKPDYPSGVTQAIAWFRSNRSKLSSYRGSVVNINVPTCTSGAVRGIVDVPAAKSVQNRDINRADCTTMVDPKSITDDIDAIMHGFASLSTVPAK
jgi:5'-nucleotidase